MSGMGRSSGYKRWRKKRSLVLTRSAAPPYASVTNGKWRLSAAQEESEMAEFVWGVLVGGAVVWLAWWYAEEWRDQ